MNWAERSLQGWLAYFRAGIPERGGKQQRSKKENECTGKENER